MPCGQGWVTIGERAFCWKALSTSCSITEAPSPGRPRSYRRFQVGLLPTIHPAGTFQKRVKSCSSTAGLLNNFRTPESFGHPGFVCGLPADVGWQSMSRHSWRFLVHLIRTPMQTGNLLRRCCACCRDRRLHRQCHRLHRMQRARGSCGCQRRACPGQAAAAGWRPQAGCEGACCAG